MRPWCWKPVEGVPGWQVQLAGIWAGLSAFILLRLVFGLWRVLAGRWAVAGTG